MEYRNQQPVVQPESTEVATPAVFPEWPTSKRGPQTTPPPPGMHPDARRPEQLIEVNYDQETGEPGSNDLERSQATDRAGSVAPDQEQSLEDASAARSREKHQKRSR